MDLIAKISEKIVFIEVKTRTSLTFGQPEDAVDVYKLKSMLRTAEIYLKDKKTIGCLEVEFDIISILINKQIKRVVIRHFRDIDVSAVF